MELYRAIASKVQAYINCRNAGADIWQGQHLETIDALTADYMPSGSGIDSGTVFCLDRSGADKLVFSADFHHMNDAGMYDGWTKHTVIVRPSLAHDFALHVTGPDKNGIKEHLAECFAAALRKIVNE